MIYDSMFVQNDLMGMALQASVVRNDVINNNIANAETPDFKKKAVRFESYLNNALEEYRQTGKIDFKSLEPSILVEHSTLAYRLDGNNVDIETEMVSLYENSVKYDVLSSGVMNNYKRLNLAINGIR